MRSSASGNSCGAKGNCIREGPATYSWRQNQRQLLKARELGLPELRVRQWSEKKKMNLDHEQIRAEVLEILSTLAPGIQLARIVPEKPLRAQIDLDSMDWLNVLVAIHERLRVNIPESDYGKLQTLDGIVAYLAPKVAEASPD